MTVSGEQIDMNGGAAPVPGFKPNPLSKIGTSRSTKFCVAEAWEIVRLGRKSNMIMIYCVRL
jgi:hypothetical protein